MRCPICGEKLDPVEEVFGKVFVCDSCAVIVMKLKKYGNKPRRVPTVQDFIKRKKYIDYAKYIILRGKLKR